MNFAERVADKRALLLHYVAQQLRVDPSVAEDIVHDTIAVCLERQEQFLGGEYEAALVNWLKTTAFRRGLSVVDPMRRPIDAGSNDRSDSANRPSQELRLNEARTRIYDAVASLSESQRTVVTCYFFHGWSVKEIAEAHGKHEGSISRLKARALEKLATMLSADDFHTWLS